MTKLEAADIAAHWWARQIGRTDDGAALLPDDTGTLVAIMRRRLKRPTPEQVTLFESILFSAILRQIDSVTWSESDPQRGSAWRAVVMDWHSDRTLSEALQAANIDKFLLPVKTTMHINPDRIRVQVGEGGEWQDVPLMAD